MPSIQASEFLNTKIALPRPHASTVPRARLFARLDRGLDRQVTLISAAPGFGKTTLVSDWAATRKEPFAWVSLDASDNDPIRFWRYVITACRAFDSNLGKSILAALRTSQQPSFEGLLTTFVNELAQLPGRCILILDDYHFISSPQVHETMAFLLDHFPAPLHLVLMTRSAPPLPLARMRARNELSEVDADELRFSPDEARSFFEQTVHLPLSPDLITRLDARTEGWAAGLRLVELMLERTGGQVEAEKLLATFSGGERQVLDYLLDEVLAVQPETIQEFLLETSFLGRLTGSLCDAVTGRTDSARLLEQLARANLFLTPFGVEGDQRWYRYHTLFAEAMQHHARQRFAETDLQARYERAVLWYEAHGLLPEAVETSLTAHAFARAAGVMERLMETRGSDEVYTLRRWIEQLPENVLYIHPKLCFSYAAALLFTLDRYSPATAERMKKPLQAAEEIWRREKNDAGLGEVLSLRATANLWQGELEQSFAHAHESLQLLPEDDANWCGSSLLITGIQELLEGRIAPAVSILIESRALWSAAQNIHGRLAATQLLGEAYAWQGEFEQASQIYRQVLTEAVGAESMLDDQAAALHGLAGIAYERNDLGAAEEQASSALELATRRSQEELIVRTSVLLARIVNAGGKQAQARERLHALVARTTQPRLLREVLAWQARLALAAGDMTTVQHWYASYGEPLPGVPRTQQEQETLLIARIRIAEVKPDAALALLETWRADARKYRRTNSELEILLLKALAYAAQSDQVRATGTLVRALKLAKPKGYRRIFLDEGEPMARLLSSVQPQLKGNPLAIYVTLLLRAFASTRAVESVSSKVVVRSPLLEPLSAQEQRVLRLLAAGLSNPEIAQELVVSTNTIKTQVQSIYRKLDVNNRDEAREMARELNLV